MSSADRFARGALDVIGYLAWFAGMSAFAFFIYLERHSPSAPNLLTGQIAEMNSHGYLFYVRPCERLTFNLALPASLGAFAMLGLVRTKLYGDFKRPSQIQMLIPMVVVFALWAYMAWPLPR